jgi:hypothetical protein
LSCKLSDLIRNRLFCFTISSETMSERSSTKRKSLCRSLKFDENSWEYSSTKFYRIRFSSITLRVGLLLAPYKCANKCCWPEVYSFGCDISELCVIKASTSTLLMISWVIWVCYCLNICCLQAVKKMLNFLWQKIFFSSLDFKLIYATLSLF